MPSVGALLTFKLLILNLGRAALRGAKAVSLPDD